MFFGKICHVFRERRVCWGWDLFKCDRNPFFLPCTAGDPLCYSLPLREVANISKRSFFFSVAGREATFCQSVQKEKRGWDWDKTYHRPLLTCKADDRQGFPQYFKKKYCSHFFIIKILKILSEKCRKCKQVVVFTFFLGDSNARWVSGLAKTFWWWKFAAKTCGKTTGEVGQKIPSNKIPKISFKLSLRFSLAFEGCLRAVSFPHPASIFSILHPLFRQKEEGNSKNISQILPGLRRRRDTIKSRIGKRRKLNKNSWGEGSPPHPLKNFPL